MPNAQTQAVALKVVLDQAIWTPPSILAFYTWMAFHLDGLPLQSGVDRAKNMLWPTLQVNWPFWGGVQALTFSVVPQPWRVAWISVVHVFWNAFLSSMNQSARASQPATVVTATHAVHRQSEDSDTKSEI